MPQKFHSLGKNRFEVKRQLFWWPLEVGASPEWRNPAAVDIKVVKFVKIPLYHYL